MRGATTGAPVDVAAPFRELFAEAARDSVRREREGGLPRQVLRSLAGAGFGALRLPRERGGAEATLPELASAVIELSAADPDAAHALRGHFGFTELVLGWPDSPRREAWLDRIAAGDLVGNATSELTGSTLADISTTVTERGGAWRLDGRKFYSTGTLYSDWVYLAAAREAADGAPERVTFAIRTDAPGVELVDDWDGFGQRGTASGTTVFDDVEVDPDEFVAYGEGPRSHIQAFYQLYLVAVMAGIGRAVTRDAADFVRDRTRSYVHANAARPAEDPQVLEVVGRLSTAAFAVESATLAAAARLEAGVVARTADGVPEDLLNAAEIAVYQAQVLATEQVPEAATRLFEIGGASATSRERGLDRHWRNARVVASHNPAIFKARTIGEWEVTGTPPLAVWARYEKVGPTRF